MERLSKFEELQARFGENSAPVEMPESSNELLSSYVRLAPPVNAGWIATESVQVTQAVLGLDAPTQIPILLEALRIQTETRVPIPQHFALSRLIDSLLRKNLPLQEEHVVSILILASRPTPNINYLPPWALLIAATRRFAGKSTVSENLQKAIGSCLAVIDSQAASSDFRKHARGFRSVLGEEDDTVPLALKGFEAWSKKADADIDQLDPTAKSTWNKLLKHAASANKAVPSNDWMETTKKLLEVVENEQFINFVSGWFALIGTKGHYPPQTNRRGPDPNESLTAESADLLRGLAWMCLFKDDIRLIRALGDAADASFKKVGGRGPRSQKLGQASVNILSNMSSPEAIAQLARLKIKTKKSARSHVENAMKNLATSMGLTTQDLEELNVPTFGFQNLGHYTKEFGTHKAEIKISNSSVRLEWFDSSGKSIKSTPSTVKNSHPNELKELKRIVSEVRKLLSTIRYRIESSVIERRNWTFREFKERYLNHPIAGTITRRLLWRISGSPCLYSDDRFRDINNNVVECTDETRVELWHPVNSEPNEVLACRQRIVKKEITQPFKQAHREIYVVTDAERQTDVYSNRFASFFLRPQLLGELCVQRGWDFNSYSNTSMPRLPLTQWRMAAELYVEHVGGLNELQGVCISDYVNFISFDGLRIRLAEIDPVLFSEVMRDVDLFVSVANIGNDPGWRDPEGQFQRELRVRRPAPTLHMNWNEYAFGKLSAISETRKQVLQSLIPALKISSRCHIDDKFLIVKGDLRTYKIHLGSGNIMMEPNDEYLCIVPTASHDDLYLPFEGDKILAVIISKAFLLADDTKIKDRSIVSQITRTQRLRLV